MSYGYNPTGDKSEKVSLRGSGIVEGIVFGDGVGKRVGIRDRLKRRWSRGEGSRGEVDYRRVVEKRVEIVNVGLERVGSGCRFMVREGSGGGMVVDMGIDGTVICSRVVDSGNYGVILDRISSGAGFIMDD